MQWSNEQLMSIEKSGEPIVVSAGAGSGKTAVLTERIFQIITKKHVSLDKLIVLTFTNAAALEMKIRVAKRLNEEKNITEEIKNALDYIDQANITTFDAFSLKIVKKYGYLLNLTNDINISDEAIISKVKQNVIDKVLDNLYQNEEFSNFLKKYIIKDDNKIKNDIIKLYEKFEYKVDVSKFISDSYKYITDDFYYTVVKKIREFVKNEQEKALDLYYKLEKYNDGSEKISKIIEDIYIAINDLNVEYPRLNFGKGYTDEELDPIRDLSDKIKNIINSIKKNNLHLDDSHLFKMVKENLNETKCIIDILYMFDNLYQMEKSRLNLFTFTDIARLSILIFEKFDFVREEIKNNTYEILVDEYQDTTDIQDYFISLISNNNTYYVGDVKQSIYGFRGANPSLFSKKMKENYLITLQKNFRSRSNVLNYVNKLFSQIMNVEYGGVDYLDGHELNYGFHDYSNDENENYEAECLTYELKKSADNLESEISIIANDIIKKVGNYTVYDKSNKVFRKAQYKDFAILTRTKKSYDDYLEIFNKLQIPLSVNSPEKFISSEEILVLCSLLGLSNNLDDRHFGYSVLRSFLFDYDDSFNDSDLIELKSRVEKVKNNSKTEYELLENLIYEFDLFDNLTKLDSFEIRRLKVYKLLEVSKNILSISMDDFDINKYLEFVKDEFKDYEVDVSLVNDNAVQIMTIHKSKGLEFPICYFAEIGKDFRDKETEGQILFSDDLGFILKTDDSKKDNPLKYLLKTENKENIISEFIRLFYVALTRAREKAIILLPVEEKSKEKNMFEFNSFKDFILYPFNINNYTKGEKIDIGDKAKRLFAPKTNESLSLSKISVKNTLVKKNISSKSVSKLIDNDVKEKLSLGIKFHKYFEIIDFFDVENSIKELNLTEFEIKMLNNFFSNPILKDIKKTYKEHYFKYKDENTYQVGIIDLILEYSDKVIIVDYKLSETNKEEYINQLTIYKNYLKTIFDKKIETYLYSIIKGEFNKICLE